MAPSRPSQPLVIGDPLPRIALPGVSGRVIDLGDQQFAGRTLLMWFVDAPVETLLRDLAGHQPALAAAEALAVVVSRRPMGDGGDDGPLCLVDAAGDLAPLLGTAPPALAIVDPRGRLAAIMPGGEAAAGIAAAAAIFAASPAAGVQAQAPVLLIDSVLEPALRDRLIAHWEAGSKLADGVAAGKRAANVADRSMKRRRDVVVDDLPLYERLRERVGRRVLPEIRRAFGVQISQMEAPRVGCYDASDGGWFRRHRDNTTKFTAHRLFAMSLNLNTSEYEGGALRFPEYGRLTYSPPAGGAVVFSCSLLHEALPVTSGRRFGVFTFFHDAAGEARVKALIEAERAAGRQGHMMRDA